MQTGFVRQQPNLSLLLSLLCFTWISFFQSTESYGQRARPNWEEMRRRLVDSDLVSSGIQDPRVLQAMRSTPRHEFVPRNQQQWSYFDMALPIGDRQTISAPFIVAYMTEQIDPQPTDKVLEIGTGSGYQAAVLSPLVSEVYSIEIVEPLGKRAARTLNRLRYKNVFTKIGDGYQGWEEHAPFDKIIVTCSPEDIPSKLVEQLKEGGMMIIPVGERYQQTLYRLVKKDGELVSEKLLPTLFVPMTGTAEENRKVLPDPSRPEIINGDFESSDPESGRASNWHHPRQVELRSADDAPQGKSYLVFSNETLGRDSHLLQGFAVDGRVIRELEISFWVKGSGIRPGTNRGELPSLVINFYDANRGPANPPGIVGPWRDTFQWQKVTSRIQVPSGAREAILHVGLLGATGELGLDHIELTPIPR